MPRRRLSVVVAAGALAVLALTGCRIEPGSAAFVGDTTHSRAQVDSVLDQYKKDVGKDTLPDEGSLRDRIAVDQVFLDVAKRYATEKNLGGVQPDYASVASQNQIPESDPFLRLLVDVQAYENLLFKSVKAS